MTRILRCAFLLIVLALAGKVASAQVAGGTPPFGSFDAGSGPDVVNLANLNSHISIPVLHKAGRGLNFTYDLSNDSSVWYPVTSGSTKSWQPVYNWSWRATTEAAVGYLSYHSYSQRDSSNCLYYYWDNWVYHDPWGVPHSFSGTAIRLHGSTSCGTTYFDGFTSGADGYTLVVNPTSNGYDMGTTPVYDAGGHVVTAPRTIGIGIGNSIDRNGNYVNANGSGQFFDTISSTTPVLTVTSPGAPTSTTFTYTAPSGAAASYTMKYGSYNIQTNFGCSNITDYGTNGTTTAYLVSEIDQPDGSKYLFTYEPTYQHSGYVTGRLKSVTLPTGGSITYSYGTNGTNGIECSDGSAATLTRTLSDGVNWNATWTYARTLGSGAASTDTITDPLWNQMIAQFQGIYETQRQVYQGTSSGTLLQTVYTCYNGSASPCTGTALTSAISSRTVTTLLPGSSNLQSRVVASYNSYGQLTEEDDYDYGSGAPGSLLRKKIVTIQTVGTYQAIQTAQIQDGLGNIRSQTTMTFDQGGVTATSGTPQHSNPSVGRGNPTTISYLVGSTSLNKTFTYYDTGNVITATDVNGAQTTFTYGACGNSFPTSISEPLGLSQSIAWNCTGGVETSVTDENGKTVSSIYTDAYFWRPNAANDQVGNQTTFYYQPNPTYSSPAEVASYLTFNSGKSVVSDIQYEDGLGRTYVDQRWQSPSSSTLDSVSTTYDAVGRRHTVSMPCSVGYGVTCSTPQTTQTYDALNRPLQTTDGGGRTITASYSQNDVLVTVGPAPAGENVKRRQSEYDALGRLTSVCEITNGPGSGTCGQTNPQTGYWTKYVYNANGNLTGVTQNAQAASGQQQARSYSYDDLSRMTSEMNPESGTTTYVYDSSASSSCNSNSYTSNGDLIRKVDANGTNTCHFYDALHRLTTRWTDRWGTDGCKRFFYDNSSGALGSIPSGVSVSNVLGRLAEAETDTCAWPITQSSLITDEWFSYTARGEISDVYESTLHSGGYYHSGTTYWANGVPNQVTGASGYSISYNVDGEGRVYSTYGGSGQNPLTSTSYNVASLPTQVNFGSLDSDSFSYDSNTMRMTQYQFNINGQSSTGALAWAANGSLAQLAITDQLNSADSQMCGYLYDDLSRISSANCGPVLDTWNANGGANIGHQCGRSDGDGWSVNVSQDPPGCFMQYGPYYTMSSTGTYLAQWVAQVDNNSADNITILRLDVNDSTTQTVVATMWVTREQFASANAYQTFSLPFTVNSGNVGHSFEFRMLWYGYSYVKEKTIDEASNSTWAQTFSYDSFGNINKVGNSSFGATYSPATNRMTSIGTSTPTYDADGNVTNDFLHTYTWNGYGRPVAIDTLTITYDALGRMVEQNRGGAYSQIVYTPTGVKIEIMTGQSLQKAFEPLPAGSMAVYTPSGLAYYRHSDWLGSDRLMTTPNRAVYGDVAYAPFGEQYAQSGTPDASFTGMNQDTVSNEYDFPAREYGIQGRWPSPDPAGLGAVDPANPQSWNRYAYVDNNPLANTDPTGLFTLIPPTTPDPAADIIIGIIDILGSLFGLFGHHDHVTPHAPPAPPGGYGAGIDPYGTWDESLPAGVQVFPHFGFPGVSSGGSGCTYGSGSCGGGVYGFISCTSGGCPTFPTYQAYLTWLLSISLPNVFIDQRILPPSMKPNVPPNSSSCSLYKDGTWSGGKLYNICLNDTSDGPWNNCVRGRLLQQFDPKGGSLDRLIRYGVGDHSKDFATCKIE